MSPDAAVLLALIAALLLAGLAVFYRLTNSRGAVTWELRTAHPEPSAAEVEKLTRERDEARENASHLRAGLDALPPDVRAAISSAIVGQGGKL